MWDMSYANSLLSHLILNSVIIVSHLFTHHLSNPKHKHTHTHTCIVLVLPLPELATWPPCIQGVSQQEAARQVALLVAGHQPHLPRTHGPSTAWPLQCSRGTHLWACKTHEMREVYGLEQQNQSVRPGLLAI